MGDDPTKLLGWLEAHGARMWMLVAVGLVFLMAYPGKRIKELFWPKRESVTKPDAASAHNVSVGGDVGQLAVGDHNVLHQTVITGPRRRSVLPEWRDKLIEALTNLPPHRFCVVTGMDSDSGEVGIAISAALSHAGWSWAQSVDMGEPTDSDQVSIGGVDRQMPTPPNRGVIIRYKAPLSDAVHILASWCRAAGLQPGRTAAPDLWAHSPADVLIEVGDAP